LSDGLSPEKIAETLAEIDDFVRSSATPNWTMPTDLLGSRLNGGSRKRCPMCHAHLILREPRIYRRLLIPGGPIVDLHGSARSRQARLIGVGLQISYVDAALREFTEEDVAYFDRIELLHQLFGEAHYGRSNAIGEFRP
jgi:hypothetical protein